MWFLEPWPEWTVMWPVPHGVWPTHDEGHQPTAGPCGPRFSPLYPHIHLPSGYHFTNRYDARVCLRSASTGIYLTITTKKKTLSGCHTPVNCQQPTEMLWDFNLQFANDFHQPIVVFFGLPLLFPDSCWI